MRGKRFLSLFLALAMILSLIPATGLAANSYTSGKVNFIVYEESSRNSDVKVPVSGLTMALNATTGSNSRTTVATKTTDENGMATITLSDFLASYPIQNGTTFDCDPTGDAYVWNVNKGVVRYLTIQTTNTVKQGNNTHHDAVLTANNGSFEFTFTCYVDIAQDAGTYTVSYDANGGTGTVNSETVGFGQNYTIADNAFTKEGYTFTGWNTKADGSGTAYAAGATVKNLTTAKDGSVKLYAQWKINEYTVSFDSDGGSEVVDQTVQYNMTAAAPDPTPTKAGFTFAGWYLNSDAYDFATPVTGNITLVAKWTENAVTTYTVTFDSNGGSTVDAQTVAEGGTATEPTAPTRDGFTFKGWKTAEDADYNFSTPVTGDLTLTAQWEANPVPTYTVTFNSDGGSEVVAQTVNANGTATEPAAPTKEGHTFAGWKTEADTVYDFAATVTGNITLTAAWTANTYTITYTDGVEDAVVFADKELTGTYGQDTPAFGETDPVREGYTFTGWSPAVAEKVNGEATYTATWTANNAPTGKVHFLVTDMAGNTLAGVKMDLTTYDGGEKKVIATVETDSQGKATIDRADFSEDIVLTENFVFHCDPVAPFGWNQDAADKGQVRTVTEATNVTVGSANQVATLTKAGLSGHFEFTFNCKVEDQTVKHTVTFINGEDQTTAQVADGEKVAEPTAPTKDGFKFLGWFADGATDPYDFTAEVKSDLTLTAKWEEVVTYTVTFDADNGTDATTQTIEADGTATAPTAPTKTGYTFQGWFLGDAESAYDFATPVTDDITLKAKWEINKYTVAFATDGGGTVPAQTVEHGQKATAPSPAPTKAGHTFLGWFAEGASTAYNFNTAVTADLVLTAKWQANTLTVTFNSDGGSTVAAKTVAYGGTITAPTAPTKEGYTFKHWVDAEGDIFSFATPITENITLKAVWQEGAAAITTFTVQYSDGVIGKIVFPTQTYTVESGKATPAFVGTPTREGYTFKGWYPTVAATVTADAVYVAQWELNPVTGFAVTIDSNIKNGTVTSNVTSAEKDSLVVLTVKADTGYELTSLKVLDKDNKEVKLSKGSSNGLYWFVMPESAVTVKAVFTKLDDCNGGVNCPAYPFTDVNTSLWYHEAVDYVLTEELFKGVSATQFSPNGTMTRAMIWTVLARMDDATLAVTNPWYKSAQNWAMLNGVSDGTDPNGSVTREQLVTMLWRFMDEPSANGSLAGFSDAGKVSSWAKEAMAWAVTNGVVNGVGNANGTVTLDPGATATRAQVAQMLMNFLTK